MLKRSKKPKMAKWNDVQNSAKKYHEIMKIVQNGEQ